MTNVNRDPKDDPDTISLVLVALWLLLVGGRWVLTPYFMFLNPSLSSALAVWDRGILLIIYLVLASTTLVVIALRFASSSQNSRTMSAADRDDPPAVT